MQNCIIRLRIKNIFLLGISTYFLIGCASNPIKALPGGTSTKKLVEKATIRKLICHSCDSRAPKIKNVKTSKRKKYQPIVLEVK